MMPIDRTLKALEVEADRKGLQLEDVDGYVPLCEFITDLEIDSCSSSWFSREDALRVLKNLICYVLPSWSVDPMAFHFKCQEVAPC